MLPDLENRCYQTLIPLKFEGRGHGNDNLPNCDASDFIGLDIVEVGAGVFIACQVVTI